MGTFIKKLIVVVIILAALVLGAGIYLGIIDSRDITTAARVESSRLASQIESGVDSIGVNVPARGGSPQDAAACRENLRRIESAKRKVADRAGSSVGSVSEADVIKELGGKLPVCPVGGKYTIGDLQRNPMCSVGGNGNMDAADDHLLPSI